jgi:hypothetical protein
MCSARNWMIRERNCDKKRNILFCMVDIKETDMNLEQNFILAEDIL